MLYRSDSNQNQITITLCGLWKLLMQTCFFNCVLLDLFECTSFVQSSKKIVDTTTTSVVSWLKKRKERQLAVRGKSRRVGEKPRALKRAPFYVTRNRNKRKKHVAMLKSRNRQNRVSSDSLRSKALDTALDRELQRRLTVQRIKLGMSAT